MTVPQLGPLELTVMQALWKDGPCTPRHVHEAVSSDPSRENGPGAYTTVLTTLQRLQHKGLVTRASEGRTHVYAAALEQLPYAQDQGRRHARSLARLGPAAIRAFLEESEGMLEERRNERQRNGNGANGGEANAPVPPDERLLSRMIERMGPR